MTPVAGMPADGEVWARVPGGEVQGRAPDYTRRCADCRHLTRYRTCRAPVAAGLIPPGDGFGIAWPGPVHASDCRAFDRKAGPQSRASGAKHPRPQPAPERPATAPGRACDGQQINGATASAVRRDGQAMKAHQESGVAPGWLHLPARRLGARGLP